MIRKKAYGPLYALALVFALALGLADCARAAKVLFPPPMTAIAEKFATIACKGTPGSTIAWQHLRPGGIISGQALGNNDGIFFISLELDPGLNTVNVEGTLVEIFSDQGKGAVPPGYTKRFAHARDLSACTDCHEKFTYKLLEGGYPGVCLSCHVIISQNPENPQDPATDSHFKAVGANCKNCHEPHYSQNPKLLEKSIAKRPCESCHKERYAGEEGHAAFEEGGCAACHDSHFSGFPHKLHAFMPEACSQCHSQGASVNLKKVHPPTDDGETLCSTCHDPHSREKSLLLKPLKATCLGCHPKILKEGHKDDLAECTKCHDPHGNVGTGLLRKDFPAGCLECHDNVKKGKNLHKPVADGCSDCHAPHSADNLAMAQKSCTNCHDMTGGSEVSKLHGGLPLKITDCRLCHEPHSSDQPKLLKKKTHFPLTQAKCDACHGTGGDKSLKVTKMADRCDKCHSTIRDLTGRGAALHDPVAEGSCTECHDPHMSSIKGYLKSPMGKVCGQCHDTASLKDGRTLHPAAETCSDCHGVHGGENKKFLKSKPPKLCIDCHDDPAKDKKVVHGALDEGCTACHDPHTGFGKAFLKKKTPELCLECHKNPAVGVKVEHPAMEEGCTACHDPHASNAKKLVKKTGNAVCLDCHKDPAAGGDAHPALDEGCTACHKPHGGPEKKLLADKPAKLCLNCHDDPVKGKKNVHPAMDEGCDSCHNGHVSAGGKLLKKTVNEVCAACHDDMKKHHVLDGSAAKSWPAAKGVFPVVGDKLSCLGCHTPHASNEGKLYPKPEADLCSSCH